MRAHVRLLKKDETVTNNTHQMKCVFLGNLPVDFTSMMSFSTSTVFTIAEKFVSYAT